MTHRQLTPIVNAHLSGTIIWHGVCDNGRRVDTVQLFDATCRDLTYQTVVHVLTTTACAYRITPCHAVLRRSSVVCCASVFILALVSCENIFVAYRYEQESYCEDFIRNKNPLWIVVKRDFVITYSDSFKRRTVQT